MSDLLERLRQRGWRLTPQRRVVAEVLRGHHVHLNAEAVHGLAQQRLPEISLATVYNTLNELVSLGEIAEVTAGEGPRRYDPNVSDTHQHLVCVRCNHLLDVKPQGEQQLGLPPEERHGYQILDVRVLFRGVCPACLEGAPPA